MAINLYLKKIYNTNFKGAKWSTSFWGPLVHYKDEIKQLAKTELKNELSQDELTEIGEIFAYDPDTANNNYHQIMELLLQMDHRIKGIEGTSYKRYVI